MGAVGLAREIKQGDDRPSSIEIECRALPATFWWAVSPAGDGVTAELWAERDSATTGEAIAEHVRDVRLVGAGVDIATGGRPYGDLLRAELETAIDLKVKCRDAQAWRILCEWSCVKAAEEILDEALAEKAEVSASATWRLQSSYAAASAALRLAESRDLDHLLRLSMEAAAEGEATDLTDLVFRFALEAAQESAEELAETLDRAVVEKILVLEDAFSRESPAERARIMPRPERAGQSRPAGMLGRTPDPFERDRRPLGGEEME